MGMWDEVCVACGGPLSSPNKETCFYYEKLSEADASCLKAQSLKGLKWLDDRVGITKAEQRIPLGPESGYGYFDVVDKPTASFNGANIFEELIPEEEDYLYGLTCHTKCFELLERDLHYTLRFHDVWPMLMQQASGTWLECTDYGGLGDYICQRFLYQDLYLAGNGWMLQDPTTHYENGERIVKVWRSIIQSGFQAEADSNLHGEDESQAGNTSAAPSETAMDSVAASHLQNLHL